MGAFSAGCDVEDQGSGQFHRACEAGMRTLGPNISCRPIVDNGVARVTALSSSRRCCSGAPLTEKAAICSTT
jgi:hypothetical protein